MSDQATPAVLRLNAGLGAGSEARWRYYYRVTACTAGHASEDKCICWHEEGTGPRADQRHESEVPLVRWKAPARKAAAKEAIDRLHTFLNAAAGEGMVLDGVDAADLYVALFPERYAATIAGLGA